MASYVYYDKSGIIRELITADYPARQGMAYDIFMYFDGVDVSPTKYNVTCRKPDKETGLITTLSWEDVTVPYSAERKLSNFEYYRTYNMLHIKVSSLDKGGLWQFTPNIDDKASALFNLFVDSNTNEVVDKALSFADYQSLMDMITELEARVDNLEKAKTASNDAQALDITEEDGVVSIKGVK